MPVPCTPLATRSSPVSKRCLSPTARPCPSAGSVESSSRNLRSIGAGYFNPAEHARAWQPVLTAVVYPNNVHTNQAMASRVGDLGRRMPI